MLRRVIALLLAILYSAPVLADGDSSWRVGYEDGGGGFWLASPEDKLKISILGYAQILQKW